MIKKSFLKAKHKNKVLPSKEDMELIAFSKKRKSPLISNDYDITFFANELYKKHLSHQIFNLKELTIYN